MKRISLLNLTIFAIFILANNTFAQNKQLTVSVEWLAEHLNDKNLVLLHVGDRAEFDAGHIAGAQFVTQRDVSAAQTENSLALQLPTDLAKTKETLENFGISDKSKIIVYFGKDWVTPTTRVYFALDYLGLGDKTAILDGGMPAWTAAGKSLTKEIKTPARGQVNLRPQPNKVADADWLRNNLKNPSISVIDARATVFYDGTNAGGRPRAGHIQSAKNIPFSSIADEKSNKFKSAEELRKIFADAGVKPGETVVAYCHIGQQGTAVYFAAKSLGYDAKLYDGSFEEWSARFDLPVTDPLADKRKTKVSFVPVEWLAQHAKDHDLKILDVRNNVGDYFTGHLPNAVHLADAALRAPRGGLPVQYLEQRITSELLSQAGINKTDRVAIYSDGTSVLGATMTAYILERLGHQGAIYVLDGGFSAYKDGQKNLVQEYPKSTNARYDVLDNRAVRATLDDIKKAIGNSGVTIIDARPTEQYRGEVNIWQRNGHIPGAINLPWRTLTEDANAHQLKSLEEIKKIVAGGGIKESDDIILYCGTSREASLEYIVLKHLLGFSKVRLYEGSWNEYSAQADLKVETGAPVSTAKN